MAISAGIRDVLAGDATLAGLLTGGLYSYAQIGRNGISRVTTPDAYVTGGFLKPCAVIKAGDLQAAAAIRDSAAGSRQIVHVYLYEDGDSGYDTIFSAQDRVVALLDRQWIAGVGFMRRVEAKNQRDPKLNNAAQVRIDFEVMK